MADLTKFLSLSGLQRYDSKIKAFIADKVAGHLLFEIVESLDSVNKPKDNVIYLIPNAGNLNNVKDEYMWINEKWELIGTTAVDLTPYYTKVDADAKFETIVNVDAVRGRVSSLETRMTTAEGNITTLQGAVDTKAEQEALNTLAGRVGTNEGKITTLETGVANAATKVELEGATGRIAANETAIANLQSGKADKATTLAGYGITDAHTKEEVEGLIDSVNTAASKLEGRVDANEGAITTLQGAVATKAESADLTALQGTVSGMYTNTQIDEKVAGEVATINAEIAKKANATDVYTKGEVDGKVTTINEAIATKANAADVYTKGEVDSKVTTINEAIATKANAADVYTKSDVYTKAEVDAMIITEAEIDALFATANA